MAEITDKEALKRFLIRCCYWYYVKCDPLTSDKHFDSMLKDLQAMEGDDIDPTSPTQMIYGDSESQYEDWAKIREDRGV